MRFSIALVALVAPLLALAAPTPKRDHPGGATAEEVLVFTFADVLEQLETQFYETALAKFVEADFIDTGFSSAQIALEQMNVMARDEQIHSDVLQSALRSWGAEPLTTCQFLFDGATADLATTIATARVVEYVGVSAYLGAATLLTDPVLLTSAGSILSIEARHSTILNVLSAGAAIPSAFDIAMTPSEILAIAGPFFDPAVPCDLGVPANPTLSITTTGTPVPGTRLEFAADPITSTDGLFCQMLQGGEAMSTPLPLSDCIVPDVNGPVVIWITSDDQPLINNVRDRATTQLVAGPTVVYIDTIAETLGAVARPGVAINGGAGAAPDAVATPLAVGGGIDLTTGPSVNGELVVKGWTNLPPGTV